MSCPGAALCTHPLCRMARGYADWVRDELAPRVTEGILTEALVTEALP